SMLDHGFSNRSGFNLVLCGTTTVIDAGNTVKMQADVRRVVRTGDDVELVPVELFVRQCDERWMSASIVPTEHPVWQALGCAESENALEVSGAEGVLVLLNVLARNLLKEA